MTTNSTSPARPKWTGMVPVDDTALAVTDTGGPGIPVVYLNGQFATQGYWRRVIAELGTGWRHITYDERARGKISRRSADYSFEAAVRDVDAVLAARGVDRPLLVGWSYGALVAAHWASRHPDRALGAVLVDGAYPGDWLDEAMEQRIRKLFRRMGWFTPLLRPTGLTPRMTAEQQAESNIELGKLSRACELGPVLDDITVPMRYVVASGTSFGSHGDEQERIRASLDAVTARNPNIQISAKVASNHGAFRSPPQPTPRPGREAGNAPTTPARSGADLPARGCRRGAGHRAAGTGRSCAGPRSAASAVGIPAAVTNSGRAEDPRWTGTAWIAVRYRDLATPITGMPNSARACAPRPGRPSGSRSAWPSTTSRRSPLRSARTAQRRELAQIELARPVAEYLGQDRGALSQHVCEGGQHGCGPGAAGARGSARPRRRTRRSPGVRRFPCLEDARTYARHQDGILAAACTSPRQAAQQVTKRNWPASSARTCNRRSARRSRFLAGRRCRARTG